MSWKPPDDDGGAPILYYRVKEEKSGDQQKCDTNECVFRKLKTGGNYSFRAQAVNRVGESEWSDLSRSAQADTAPGRVQNIRLKDRGDGTITVAWDKPATNTSKILDYTITWVGSSGQDVVPGDRTEFTATGLNNNEKYIFTIKARQPGRILAPTVLPGDAAARHAAGTGRTGRDRPGGRTQPDQPAHLVAGGAAEGPGPRLHGHLHQRHATGAVPGCQKPWRSPAPTPGCPTTASPTPTACGANQPLGEAGNRSVPSEGTSIEAVGARRPGAPSRSYATGNARKRR